jgi:hypothetical protein
MSSFTGPPHARLDFTLRADYPPRVMRRISLAFRCFFRVLLGKPLPPELAPRPEPPALPAPPAAKPAPAKPAPAKADPTSGALLLLGLFQREGRLVDFLHESIDGYDDAAIGAAVRDVHKGLKKVLAEHIPLVPVVDAEENEPFTVDAGFDPQKIRLTGNVAGSPPFKGTLRHHGWRAGKVALPDAAAGLDLAIVAPAEVEV